MHIKQENNYAVQHFISNLEYLQTYSIEIKVLHLFQVYFVLMFLHFIVLALYLYVLTILALYIQSFIFMHFISMSFNFNPLSTMIMGEKTCLVLGLLE